MDGQLRESRTRDVQEIAWILMFADDIALGTGAGVGSQLQLDQMLDSNLEPGEDRALKSRRDARSLVASKPAG